MTEPIVVPYSARWPQQAIHDALAESRWVVAVCHRRLGKTVAAVNQLLVGALTCPRERPRFAYIAPTYRQAKAVSWDYLQHFGRALKEFCYESNQNELRVDFSRNGGQVRLFGADNPDSLRGLYFDGVVLDEYGQMSPALMGEVIRPALADRQGWALICGTPTGDRHFAEIADMARLDPEWRYVEFKASQTGILDEDELASSRKSMTEAEFQQEFECSWTSAVRGAVFGKELQAARDAGRITRVPYDPAMAVETDWDLGMADSTSIWFSQSLRSGEVRLIDYYEATGEGLPHYAQVLQAKGYTYGAHWAPHDIRVRELGSGRSRLDTAAALGIKFNIVPQPPAAVQSILEDGIHAARMLLPRCWFDAEKCRVGLEALTHYRREYRDRLQTFQATPTHDWASHAADAFRGLAVRHRTPVEPKKPKAKTDGPIYDSGRSRALGWMRLWFLLAAVGGALTS